MGAYNKSMVHALDARSALRAWRDQAGISSAEVARRMGVTRGVVNRIEKDPGRSKVCTLARYAEACGIGEPVIRLDMEEGNETIGTCQGKAEGDH